jgi:hypothetical protein
MSEAGDAMTWAAAHAEVSTALQSVRGALEHLQRIPDTHWRNKVEGQLIESAKDLEHIDGLFDGGFNQC